MIRLPSPAMCVALIALVVGLGGAGYSATGGNFILGQPNTATSLTSLTAPFAGKTLRLDNTSAAASATALGLFVTSEHTPFTVNSSVKVANLNADRLDGFDSTGLGRKQTILFALVGGQISAPIPLPIRNQPIFLMAMSRSNPQAIGQVTLFWNTRIGWVGQESQTGLKTVGFSDTPGAHILYVDQGHLIDIEVSSASAIRVRNASTDAKSVAVTLMW